MNHFHAPFSPTGIAYDLFKKILARHTHYDGSKRAFDLLGAMLLSVILCPILLAVIALVLCQRDGGPVLYRHQRVGRDARMFGCLKFRTMCLNADDVLRALLERDDAARSEWQMTGKLKNDPRVTRVGKVIRSLSLDELPQLWNVIRGEMSLVGPRPVTVSELEGPYNTYGGYNAYLLVRPGITGLWQVNGRSRVGYQERVMMDRSYVENLSFLSDMRIVGRTIFVVLRRDGAC